MARSTTTLTLPAVDSTVRLDFFLTASDTWRSESLAETHTFEGIQWPQFSLNAVHKADDRTTCDDTIGYASEGTTCTVPMATDKHRFTVTAQRLCLQESIIARVRYVAHTYRKRRGTNNH